MNSTYKTVLTIISGALIILFSAFINGFPIVYSDTSTYIASGFELETPFDRPIVYGLFLRFSSFNGLSLWLTILFQGLIVSFLVYRLLKICIPNLKKVNMTFIGIISFISVCTSASWTASQLIADIFTPILILSLIILVIGQPNKRTQIFLYSIFLVSVTTHMSHVSFSIMLILSILVVRRLKILEIKNHVKIRPLVICLSLAILSILTMGSALSKSKHGFLMGAFIEHGIVQTYLDDHCNNSDYKLCEYKDSLPDKAWIFLWNEDSPFYKMGGWSGTKEEFNEIIFNTLTTPKYIGLHFKESFKATVDQLTKFKIGDGNGPYGEETQLYKRINKYFEHEISNYESSLQNNRKLSFLDWYNTIFTIIILLSIISLLLVLYKLKNLDKKILSVISIVILGITINAWACGTLANAIDRLGTKVIWLIPLVVIIGILNIWSKRKLLTKPKLH